MAGARGAGPGTPPAVPDATTDRLLTAFQRAASAVPAYRVLLRERGVDPSRIVDLQTFTSRAPVLDKSNTFDRFPIEQLCAGGVLPDLAGVLTSSGHGGRFSFGLGLRAHRAGAAAFIDRALDVAFGVATRRTLAINCLPMGVGFSSTLMTVATTSVREDMVAALVRTFGPGFEQLLLVGDPLFLKRLLDHAAELGLDWRRHRLGVILGEEIFGEHFRSYVSARLGLDADRPGDGYVMSSFGVGELGLHLCYETPATIAVRRAAFRDPALARELFGTDAPLPAVLAYDPRRSMMEALDADGSGDGRLAVSMLDPELPVPLLRYRTGDAVRLLDPDDLARRLARRGVVLPGPLPSSLLALRGRDREVLPDGSHVATYKDRLYTDPQVADRLTGAFRVRTTGDGPAITVQLARGAATDATFEQRLRDALQAAIPSVQVDVCDHASFPYGMGLDYERKFTYYTAGA